MNEYIDEFKQAFDSTYNAIARDLGEAGGESEMGREQLFEICCDYIHAYGELSDAAQAAWEKLNYDEKMALVPVVFEYEIYEL